MDLENPSRSMRRWRRRTRSAATAVVVGGALIIAACGDDDVTTREPDTAIPQLDLTTMEAETEFGTVEAQRATTSYTARLGDDRVIGIAFLDDMGVDAGAGEISVRLYEGGRTAYMFGEIDADGTADLASNELSDFDARVEFVIGDDVATGVAVYPDDTIDFTAHVATGDAGVCWARGPEQEPDVVFDWVVLDDGDQWGCVCVPPGLNNPCCQIIWNQ
jgi:hypothetical protein